MVINSNLPASRAVRLLSESSTRLARSIARLSSGSKITSPEDDAAGLAVSIKLGAENRRNRAAQSNLQNAISFTQTQDGYLQKVQKALVRMSELTVLAQDVTKTDADRGNYDAEFQKLSNFIDATFDQKFNDIGLFTFGSSATTTVPSQAGATEVSNVVDTQGTSGYIDISYDFFAGADEIRVYYPPRSNGGSLAGTTGVVAGTGTSRINFGQGNSTSIEIVVDEGRTPTPWNYSATIVASAGGGAKVTTDGAGNTFALASVTPVSVSGSIGTLSNAQSALGSVKTAVDDLANRRSTVGSNLTRLQAHVGELDVLQENLDAAMSRIADTDVADESTKFARNSILVQSGTAMLAQANVLPELALRLLHA